MSSLHLYFEHSPLFILLCLAMGLGYAYLLYSKKSTWSRRVNNTLFTVRTLLVTLLSFLFIAPLLRQTLGLQEKPSLVFLLDNSTSIRERTDSMQWSVFYNELQSVMQSFEERGFDTPLTTLSTQLNEPIYFDHSSSDLNGAAQRIVEEYEGKNLTGIVVVSDGLYNSGTSPLYSPPVAPIFTVGIGDTIQQADVRIKNLFYNKEVYQGNFFSLRVETISQEINDEDITVRIYRKGKEIAKQKKKSAIGSFTQFDFEIEAKEKGMQRIDVVLDSLHEERNTKNNQASAYIDVAEGKKKILLVSPAPHPDNKVIRRIIEQSKNYAFALHIPGIQEISREWLNPKNLDLVIFQQAIDRKGKTISLFDKMRTQGVALFIMLGEQTDIQKLETHEIPISFQYPNRQDQVTPKLNTGYKNFELPKALTALFKKYPPVYIPYGKVTYPAYADILLYQQIDSLKIDRPLLFTLDQSDRKRAVLIGNNIWKWRMSEVAETGKAEGFDMLFSKLIRYLSATENRRKFQSFPIQNEFTISEPIIFESQLYNDLFEPVYGYPIKLELKDEKGVVSSYQYTNRPGRSRYIVGGLEKGVYEYQASTVLKGKKESVQGEFLITEQHAESQNLTAHFELLREWSKRSGGKFYKAQDIHSLVEDFSNKETPYTMRFETSFHPLINIKMIFIVLLLLVGTEWFIRKFTGSY